MPFRLQSGAFVSFLMLGSQRAQLAAANFFCIEDPVGGPLDCGGKKLREATAEELGKAMGKFYLVPRPGAAGGAAGAGVGAAAAAAAVVVPVALPAARPTSQVKARVTVYVPEVYSLQDGNHAKRTVELRLALTEKPNTDILLAPEGYYCNWSADKKMKPFSRQHYAAIQAELRALSQDFPNTLIIPGTIVCYPDASANAANITCALLGGDFVRGTCGTTMYFKQSTGAEEGQKHLAWQSGDRGCLDFTFKGLNCRLEICADHRVVPMPPVTDLHLITGLKFGKARTDAVGWCVLADGSGLASLFCKHRPTAVETVQNKPLHTFALEWPKEIVAGEVGMALGPAAVAATGAAPTDGLLALIGALAGEQG